MGTYWSVEECAWIEHVPVSEPQDLDLPEPREDVAEAEGALTLS